MEECIGFEVVIFAAVAADFEFGSEAVGCSFLPCFCAGLEDSVEVSIEVECPLVKVACCDGDEVAMFVVFHNR